MTTVVTNPRTEAWPHLNVGDLGRHVYGAAAIFLGSTGLWWMDFATTWQPVPAQLPGRTVLACTIGIALICCGIALQWAKGARIGSLGLMAIYLLFVCLWAVRAGVDPTKFVSWLGCAEQLALVLGAITTYTSTVDTKRRRGCSKAARVAFGVCFLVFGAAHFVYLRQTAAITPPWLPPGPYFWAIATGLGHLAAGLALLSGMWAAVAARSATLMFIIFQLLVWLPLLVSARGSHMAWTGNAVNLALIGAIWVISDALASSSSDDRG